MTITVMWLLFLCFQCERTRKLRTVSGYHLEMIVQYSKKVTSAISGVVSLFQRKQSFQIYSHSDDKKKPTTKQTKQKKQNKNLKQMQTLNQKTWFKKTKKRKTERLKLSTYYLSLRVLPCTNFNTVYVRSVSLISSLLQSNEKLFSTKRQAQLQVIIIRIKGKNKKRQLE